MPANKQTGGVHDLERNKLFGYCTLSVALWLCPYDALEVPLMPGPGNCVSRQALRVRCAVFVWYAQAASPYVQGSHISRQTHPHQWLKLVACNVKSIPEVYISYSKQFGIDTARNGTTLTNCQRKKPGVQQQQ